MTDLDPNRPGMKQGPSPVLLVLLGAVILAMVVPWVLRNQLVDYQTRAESQWHQVEIQLARQSELLPKLVAVAKRYASHEESIIEKVLAADRRYQTAPALQRPEAAAEIDGAITAIMEVGSRYPDLGADEHYRSLSHEIAGTKNRIAVERMRYNEAVGRLNARLNQYPWQWLSSGIEEREYFPVSAEQIAEPQLEI